MPSSPLVAGYILRSFQSTTVSASFSVSTKKLQALLPAGWTALSLPTGSSVIRVACGWSTRIVLTQPMAGYAAGTYGPYNEALVSTFATNTGNASLQSYTLAALEDNQEAVDLFNAIFGAGSAQYADITLRINETDSALASSCTAREQPAGLRFHLTLQGPDQTSSQFRPSSPGAGAGLIKIGAGASFWVSGGSDSVVLPPSGVTLNPGSLALPGGSLPMLGVMPSSSGFASGFSFNGEVFYAPQ